MLCRATQDVRVMVKSSDKTWSIGERNGKSLQYSCLENLMNSMKRQKDTTLKDELPRSVGAQYAVSDKNIEYGVHIAKVLAETIGTEGQNHGQDGQED